MSVAALLAGCVGSGERVTRELRDHIDTIVIIYAENRSFDNLFGSVPGARGVGEVVGGDGKPLPAYVAQRDRDGRVLPALPKTWKGVTAKGVQPAVTEAQSGGLPNAPFPIETAFTPASGVTLGLSSITRDLHHRFYENQMQIDGGRNDGFAAWSNAGGLTMGHYDYRDSGIVRLAQRFALADNFFQGAFGGSFLNHLYLICACAPEYPNADTSPARAMITRLDRDGAGHYLPRLSVAPDSPASALDGPPKFVNSSSLTPKDYFGDGTFRAINTMQPPYQPSGVPPAPDEPRRLYANREDPNTLPAQSMATIGDRLDDRHVDWAWYSGAWKAALADGTQAPGVARSVIYAPSKPAGAPDFQPHHQPFNYFARLDPVDGAAYRQQHLKDADDLIADAAAGTLPPVVFYKPQGNLNQHPDYASVSDGDVHIASLVEKLMAGPQWKHMVIVITYDEFGGFWDHVAPPAGDLLGPGTRIPALIVSPFAKAHFIDHTPYDTGSVLRLIRRRFELSPLPGIEARDAAIRRQGGAPLGDLTNALQF